MVEITCPRCHESFTPETEYEFPKQLIYWHECADGVITQITKERKFKYRKVPSWVKQPTEKDRFNKMLKIIYDDKTKKDEDEDFI